MLYLTKNHEIFPANVAKEQLILSSVFFFKIDLRYVVYLFLFNQKEHYCYYCKNEMNHLLIKVNHIDGITFKNSN